MALFHFPATSRYFGTETATRKTRGGRTVRYLKRRFLPQPEGFSVIAEHAVEDGERLDNITAKYLGDPEIFWRVADANRAMRPEDLTTPVGRRLKITLPEGVPGISNA